MNKYRVTIKSRIAIDVIEEYDMYGDNLEHATKKALYDYTYEIDDIYERDNYEFIEQPTVIDAKPIEQMYYFSISVYFTDGTSMNFEAHTRAVDSDIAMDKVEDFLDEKYPLRIAENDVITLLEDVHLIN